MDYVQIGAVTTRARWTPLPRVLKSTVNGPDFQRLSADGKRLVLTSLRRNLKFLAEKGVLLSFQQAASLRSAALEQGRARGSAGLAEQTKKRSQKRLRTKATRILKSR